MLWLWFEAVFFAVLCQAICHVVQSALWQLSCIVTAAPSTVVQWLKEITSPSYSVDMLRFLVL